MFDSERQIRFLYPPVFFLASLFLGVRLDNNIAISDVLRTIAGDQLYQKAIAGGSWGTPAVALAIAGGLVATIAAGFLISTVTIAWLKAYSTSESSSGSYEAAALPKAYDLRRHLGLSPEGQRLREDALFLSATLDHEVMSKPVHQWVFRRWTAFNVYAHSVTALLLALGVGYVLGIVSWKWTAISSLAAGVFWGLALSAHRETMGMLRFQSHRRRQSPELNVRGNAADDAGNR